MEAQSNVGFLGFFLQIVIRRRKRFDIHLLTKMSDMTRRFEVILTSFLSDKRNGQVQV